MSESGLAARSTGLVEDPLPVLTACMWVVPLLAPLARVVDAELPVIVEKREVRELEVAPTCT